MQNSERFRRGVVLPLDDRAEQQLHADNVDDDTAVTWLEIGDSTFGGLCDLGLFDRLNDKLGTLIDEYEEELIPAQSLEEALTVVQSIPAPASEQVQRFLAQLCELLRSAKSTARPVFFVL